MPTIATSINIEQDIKQESIALFSELGIDLSAAVNMFLRQCLRVQGIPFIISRNEPNADTIAAMNEYYTIKEHPECYKRYNSFREAMNEN